jgi:hypothetical protein
MFVLVIIGCSGRSIKSSENSKSAYPLAGKTEIVGGVSYTLALKKYNVRIGESVKIFFTLKNLTDTTVTLNLAGAPEFHFDVFHGEEVIYYEPSVETALIWSMNLTAGQEKLYRGAWPQTTYINGNPGPQTQVPADSYKIRAYLSGYQLPQLETTAVITK